LDEGKADKVDENGVHKNEGNEDKLFEEKAVAVLQR
jgi:hypothetical protein